MKTRIHPAVKDYFSSVLVFFESTFNLVWKEQRDPSEKV